MRRQLSVFGLLARRTVYKAFLLLIALSAVETVLFRLAIPAEISETYYSEEHRIGIYVTVEDSHFGICLAVGFVLLTVLLCLVGTEGKTKVSYTFRRLPVSERSIYLWQALYNALCYLLFWGEQALTACGLAKLYTLLAPEKAVTSQSEVMAFYRSELLRKLLPLDNPWLLLGNLGIVLALAFVTARYPIENRKGHRAPVLAIASVLAVFYYFLILSNGFLDTAAVAAAIVGAVIALLTMIFTLLFAEDYDDGDEDRE